MKRTRLKSRLKKQKRWKASSLLVGTGAGLATLGAVPYALGAKESGGEVIGAGLGLVGAGIGVGILEGIGERMQGRKRKHKK